MDLIQHYISRDNQMEESTKFILQDEIDTPEFAETKRHLERLGGERFGTMYQHFDMVLPSAYFRGKERHLDDAILDEAFERIKGMSRGLPRSHRKTREQVRDELHAVRIDVTEPNSGTGLATRWLADSGYIQLSGNGVYAATEKGIRHMEEHYAGETLCGVLIDSPQ